MCYRRIFVDCHNCRHLVLTDETFYDAHCRVLNCTVGNAANRHEHIEHLEVVREERDRCPLCTQYDATEPFTGGLAPPVSSHMYMAPGGDNMTAAWATMEPFTEGLAPLESSHMYMAPGGENMTAARDPRFQIVQGFQGTGPTSQEWGNLAAPHQQYPEQSSEPEQIVTSGYGQSKVEGVEGHLREISGLLPSQCYNCSRDGVQCTESKDSVVCGYCLRNRLECTNCYDPSAVILAGLSRCDRCIKYDRACAPDHEQGCRGCRTAKVSCQVNGVTLATPKSRRDGTSVRKAHSAYDTDPCLGCLNRGYICRWTEQAKAEGQPCTQCQNSTVRDLPPCVAYQGPGVQMRLPTVSETTSGQSTGRAAPGNSYAGATDARSYDEAPYNYRG
ncbi:hypothetical protein LTR70_004755 [Exophiala xenobiotica]|uniref:Zn(2)-C6 fungal-type domain-containing protein n=1 Tax=Lithohypha guttulata TaxID=1690604 RepID=A0ABR0KCB7_9EURO|nr:hypothetical protein LTR24_004371 [Lithohypha guttulata]KAK5319969.1 hypothetical protein LTR70_004755 [Exophiala xenobiotica]